MTTLREAAQMALEALEGIHVGNMTPMAEENWNKALTALRQALAQPEPEPRPVAWMWEYRRLDGHIETIITYAKHHHPGDLNHILSSLGDNVIPLYTENPLKHTQPQTGLAACLMRSPNFTAKRGQESRPVEQEKNMNREDVIYMAREVGFDDFEQDDMLIRFAAIVAAAEREACAKLVEDKFDFCGDELLIAEAIRARGEITSLTLSQLSERMTIERAHDIGGEE